MLSAVFSCPYASYLCHCVLLRRAHAGKARVLLQQQASVMFAKGLLTPHAYMHTGATQWRDRYFLSLASSQQTITSFRCRPLRIFVFASKYTQTLTTGDGTIATMNTIVASSENGSRTGERACVVFCPLENFQQILFFL